MSIQFNLISTKDNDFLHLKSVSFDDLFVKKLLETDIISRSNKGKCKIWVYKVDNRIVAFSTLDLSDDWSRFTDSQQHFYIPLLAVVPEEQGKGYGKYILNHVLDEATIAINFSKKNISDYIFLDVYETSRTAKLMYEKNGFVSIHSEDDPLFNNERFHVMAKNLSL